MIVLFN